MWTLSDSVVKARKPYRCDAYERIMEVYEDGYFTYAELRSIVRMRRQNGLILKGQVYQRQVNVTDEIYTWRADPEMSKIYFKYNLNEDL